MTEQEQQKAKAWFEEHFKSKDIMFPFSFNYNDGKSAIFLKSWKSRWNTGKSEEGLSRQILTLSDPETKLECRCEATTFDNFPAVEWVMYFKNNGSAPSPIIDDILPLDTDLEIGKDQPAIVHHAKGSDCKIDDFEPLESKIGIIYPLHLAPQCGRSSDCTLPFFNLEMGSEGVIGAIGWTGAWKADISRGEDDTHINLSAGMKKTHLRLMPGEEIRTPRILLLFWEDDRTGAHNMLRQFILTHHTPYYDDKVLQAPICDAFWGKNKEEVQIAKARWWKDNNIPLEYIWIDAGWHGNGVYDENSTTLDVWWEQIGDWGTQVGSWWPNKAIYPNGLAPVGKAYKEMGYGFVLWMEPERVYKDTHLVCEHPEWLLGPDGDNYLFNLGMPEARQALTDLVLGILVEGRVTCYRQDFNFDPSPYWEKADAPDRVGMSEIRHIEGLYAFWDELRARIPNLVIDNCASGGRRIDLETISRSIPLWRSDYQCASDFDPIGMQGQTQGLAPWVPLSTGCYNRIEEPDTYALRSALGPGIVMNLNTYGFNPSPRLPVDWVKRSMNEEFEVRKYFYGDFYPLLSYSLADDIWAAWQYDRPDLGEGMVLAMRRPKSPFTSMIAPLHGLDADAIYELHPADGTGTIQAKGSELAQDGLTIEISEKPGSALYIYRKS
ncbi:alpha-galactosidase [bacterium]|nr:alpha-galactosidase [bacterium]